MSAGSDNVSVRMGFLPESHAIADPDHPGLLRAGERASGPYGDDRVELHDCGAVDLSVHNEIRTELAGAGFDTVDLSAFDSLQQTLAGVTANGEITDEDASAIRSSLDGATLEAAGSGKLTVLHIADEGLIMRRSGPNGLPVGASGSQGMNGHAAATSIHADQDVFGTPLTQLMDGRAPELFRHDSPDGHNHDAGLMLVNLWIPLQQITQPLVLADGRSIDRRRHQLRYGLATTSFLEREDEMEINDIWTFLFDPEQRWYMHSTMDHRSAYVFNTLSTPHGSCTLPGEDVAERCYRALEDAEAAASSNDLVALREAAESISDVVSPPSTPAALRDAIERMVEIARSAADDPDAVSGERAEAFSTSARSARERLVRMSIELRLVVSVDSSSDR